MCRPFLPPSPSGLQEQAGVRWIPLRGAFHIGHTSTRSAKWAGCSQTTWLLAFQFSCRSCRPPVPQQHLCGPAATAGCPALPAATRATSGIQQTAGAGQWRATYRGGKVPFKWKNRKTTIDTFTGELQVLNVLVSPTSFVPVFYFTAWQFHLIPPSLWTSHLTPCKDHIYLLTYFLQCFTCFYFHMPNINC